MVRPRESSATIVGFFGGDIEGTLAKFGALLFRDFPIRTDEDFAGLVTSLARRPLDYRERSTKRTRTASNVYTSTEYPATKGIAAHSENSFQLTVPGKILFFAKRPSDSGGETPLAANTRIVHRLDADVLRELRQREIRYVRNFDGGFDLSWQEAFQTETRAEVESYCRINAIDYEWTDPDHLRTWQTRPATRHYPRTGQEVWFNQLHLFHSSNLDPAMRTAMVDSLGVDGLPRNAVFGDGTAISDELVDHVRKAIAASEVAFPWSAGDVLVADNLLISHGRRPYSGTREVRVALIDPVDLREDA
ncbi:TauD/TfdA family dioxygenase [Lipingzhangella sp. LS1_29]|uniref:TauD/TfdA family dioxygenase n=2 Tax=Lipingzhangella rawalii TaxID=2055835 RepID=A0ABU2H3P1_9ACTN|nr:TauD/TfdA family dioxygenase [Lipingzhangella rawalii]